MSDISQWSTSAASNNSAPPNGAPEGMAPSTVNDSMREMMAATARWYSDMDGTLIEAGSGNAYVVTTNNVHAALADIPFLVFRAARSNTGAATLDVDGLGAKAIESSGIAIIADEIIADTVVAVAYNATSDAFDLMNPALAALGTFGALAYLNTVNNAQWSGTDLAIANGGTGESSASAALAALAGAPLTLSGTNFSSLDEISGSDLAATDAFLVDNGGVSEKVEVRDVGFRIQSQSGNKTLAVGDMNSIIVFDGTADLSLPDSVLTLGAPVVVMVNHATQVVTVKLNGSAQLESIFHPGSAASVEDTIQAGGTGILYQTASGRWKLTGDIAD